MILHKISAAKKVKVDWSYGCRKKTMAMLKCASGPSQEKITNYFDLVENRLIE